MAGLVTMAASFVVLVPLAGADRSPSKVQVGQAPMIPTGSATLGSAASSERLTLNVVLAPRDPAALASFIDELYRHGSSDYHRFLAPGQFGPRFGATESTIAGVSGVLSSLGLAPGKVSANDLSIPVPTTVAKAEAAFNVKIGRYRLSDRRVAYANTTAPEIPAPVASDVTDIIGLSDVAAATPDLTEATTDATDSTASSSVQPVPTGPMPCAAASDTRDAYTANQLADAYGFTTGAYASGRLGAGEIIALAELEPFSSTDIAAYETCYGIATTVNTVNINGGPQAGFGSGEAAGDIEDVAGLAPDATIDVYQAPNAYLGNIYDVYSTIAADDTAQVVSTSWLICEAAAGESFAESEEPIFEEMATQGQSMLAATGDVGSTGCYQFGGSDALSVDDAASDPYVTAVGGTQISALGSPPSETAWNQGGGGISQNWQMPSYQQALGVNANSSGTSCGAPSGDYCREVPDVSAMAGENSGAAADSHYALYYDGSWELGGGTSYATPLWGALAALADEGCATPAGFLNPALYTHSGDLNDITSGNNDQTSTGYTGGLYPATPGYDMATGLGTPTSALFAPGLLCSAPSGKPTISSFAANPSSVFKNGGSVTLTANVANAVSCAFTANQPVSGLLTSTPCRNGTVDDTVELPPNTTKQSVVYRVTLAASGGKTKTKAISLIESTKRPLKSLPAITSGNATTFTVGTVGTFAVTASGYPAPTYNESGASLKG